MDKLDDMRIDVAYQKALDEEFKSDPEKAAEWSPRCPPNVRMLMRMVVFLIKACR